MLLPALLLVSGAGAVEIENCGEAHLELAGSPPPALQWAPYGEAFHVFAGIDALSNGGADSGRCYQCTELIARFVRDVYGFDAAYCGGYGDGRVAAKGYASKFSGATATSRAIAPFRVSLRYSANGRSTCRPVVGSILSAEIGKAGHVAIIRDLRTLADGSLEAVLFAQHGFTYGRVGEPVTADKARFTKDASGVWSGVYLPRQGAERAVVGWTNARIVARDALVDGSAVPTPSRCTRVTAEDIAAAGSICWAIALKDANQ